MHATVTSEMDRAARIDVVSSRLLPSAALLCRQLGGQLDGGLSRSELCLLTTLSERPRRITELAERERLAQPTMTLLVKRLEEQGMVSRERQAEDARVVLVRLTDAGTAALEDYRAQASEALGARLAELPDEQVEALAAATQTLAELVAHLQQEPPPSKQGGPPHGSRSHR